jgi:hypothetical protein
MEFMRLVDGGWLVVGMGVAVIGFDGDGLGVVFDSGVPSGEEHEGGEEEGEGDHGGSGLGVAGGLLSE